MIKDDTAQECHMIRKGKGYGLWCLTPLSIIFQLYLGGHSGQFYWWTKSEYLEKTTNLPQVTEKINVVYSTPRNERDSNSQC
jgi:hypothetical protein